MTIPSTDDVLIRKCTVQIFVSERPGGYGFFVAPDKLLTCAHVIVDSEGDTPKKIASDIKIHWSDQILPAQVTGIDEEVDLALLSIELTDHPCLPLNEDVVSFEVLRVPGHKALTVKGFAGDAEKIMFEADGDDIRSGDSGMPLFHPRTRSVCGLISGRDETRAVMAIHIKNALKRFPKLANKQDNIQNLPSNTIKIFIVYDKNDEALFNKLVQLLHDLHLTNPALYWDYVEESEIEKESWSGSQQRHPSATFGTAHIVLLLVNADFHDNNAYYKDYVQRAWERYKSGKARVIQVLLSNTSPVPDWSQESMAFGDFAERIREVIEALNSSNP